jgi:membrane-bound lytic murein transglycosylase A
MIRVNHLFATTLWLAFLTGCASIAPQEPLVCPAAVACPICEVCTAPPGTTTTPLPLPAKTELFEPGSFADLPGWRNDNMNNVLGALRASCARLRNTTGWQDACAAANSVNAAGLRDFFEARFVPWRVADADGGTSGLVTGYYEPLLRGSRARQGAYGVPLYGPPDDLLTIDLAAINPELRNMRLRGRIEGRRIVPYFSRAEIDRGAAPLSGKELVWVDDAIEAFFLQIQGSGRIQLNTGETLRLGYADQNGHPYVSIGRTLIERGELAASAASMQGIQAWARANPARLPELLAQNPSYVFFRELPRQSGDPSLGPPGAMGAPLTPERSIAVDPRFIPLGAPVYLATTRPGKEEPLNRLVFAQDTGGAIRGAVRADYFWGFGADAGAEAGRMRQQGRLWVLWPKGSTPPKQ